MCGAVCPTSAISYRLDEDGFIRPEVDPKACIECGRCVSVCYRYDEELKRKDESDLISSRHYAARSMDPARVSGSSSGGMAMELAEQLLRESFECVGVEYHISTRSAAFGLATRPEEAEGFRGSKYIQAWAGEAFSTVLSQCREKRFGVFGLPCHIYALDRALRRKKCRERHILVELYCHGCPSFLLWKRYLEMADRVSGGEEPATVLFRTKRDARWGQSRVGLYDHKGEPLYLGKMSRDPFYDLFFCDQVLNPSCGSCLLRGDFSHSDIRLLGTEICRFKPRGLPGFCQ